MKSARCTWRNGVTARLDFGDRRRRRFDLGCSIRRASGARHPARRSAAPFARRLGDGTRFRRHGASLVRRLRGASPSPSPLVVEAAFVTARCRGRPQPGRRPRRRAFRSGNPATAPAATATSAPRAAAFARCIGCGGRFLVAFVGAAGGGGAIGAPGLYCTTPSSARARRSSKSRRVLSDSTCMRRFLTSMPRRVASTTRLLNISKLRASSSSRVCSRWLMRSNSSLCFSVDRPLQMQHVEHRPRVDEQLHHRVEQRGESAAAACRRRRATIRRRARRRRRRATATPPSRGRAGRAGAVV